MSSQHNVFLHVLMYNLFNVSHSLVGTRRFYILESVNFPNICASRVVFVSILGSQTLGGALAPQLKGVEPVGDPPGLRQHQGSDQPASGPGISLEESPKLADDERGLGSS